ncbi:sigma-70 family RNA polymerase sigma factor [Soonwooa sp.]|uniref:RNA polymerase sigma factor n=1 Tax=Soonwooa sp. TaxID=1938592 RepID=UPI002898140F|nr:sigma-70 family RNA polymerase sigma factor [Soonwooa sp.]
MKDNFQHIFNLVQKGDRQAQKMVFDMFSGRLLFVASSYVGNLHDAEDVLMEAFFKAFTKIETCQNSSAFSAWLRKIVVNESISFIRKKQNILYVDSEFIENKAENFTHEVLENEDEIDLKALMDAMPTGYKIIFNLIVFEEKKHKEVAEILNISEGTSKSQYSKAKKFLADFILKQKIEKQNVEKS